MKLVYLHEASVSIKVSDLHDMLDYMEQRDDWQAWNVLFALCKCPATLQDFINVYEEQERQDEEARAHISDSPVGAVVGGSK